MKPVLYLIPAFDSLQGDIIKFSWLGNQPISNTLRIKENFTNVIVYEQTQTTMRLEHIVHQNSGLINGTLYNVSVKVTDGKGVDSEWSDITLFYCFSMPTFQINIEDGQIIQSQTYGVDITYSQTEGEQLQSYRVKVLNSNREVIYDSNNRYIIDTVRITNLQDNNHYYIIATGETVNGMHISTDEIEFFADFVKSEAYFMLDLQNMYDTGGVYMKSNIIFVEGTSDSEVTYIDNEIADLTNNVVHFNEGFSISNDFSLLIKGKQFQPNKQILKIAGNDEVISVKYIHDTINDKYYFELNSVYGNIKYMIVSSYINNSEEVSLWIRRKDTLFTLEVLQ